MIVYEDTSGVALTRLRPKADETAYVDYLT